MAYLKYPYQTDRVLIGSSGGRLVVAPIVPNSRNYYGSIMMHPLRKIVRNHEFITNFLAKYNRARQLVSKRHLFEHGKHEDMHRIGWKYYVVREGKQTIDKSDFNLIADVEALEQNIDQLPPDEWLELERYIGRLNRPHPNIISGHGYSDPEISYTRTQYNPYLPGYIAPIPGDPDYKHAAIAPVLPSAVVARGAQGWKSEGEYIQFFEQFRQYMHAVNPNPNHQLDQDK